MHLPYPDKIIPTVIGAAVGGAFSLLGKRHEVWASLRRIKATQPLTDAEAAVKQRLAEELAVKTSREKVQLVDELLDRLGKLVVENVQLKGQNAQLAIEKAAEAAEHLRVLTELRQEIAALRADVHAIALARDGYAQILKDHGLLPEEHPQHA